MASYNRVVLVGNLTRDIELRYTTGGTAVTDIGIAVNDRRKSATGEWVDEVTYVDVTLWGRTAEVASEYLGKGSPILVEGRLKYESWETDGQKRSKLKVVGERMQMLSGSQGGSTRTRGDGQDFRPQNVVTGAAQEHASGEPGPATHDPPPGNREAQPTGEGPGYDDPNIPF